MRLKFSCVGFVLFAAFITLYFFVASAGAFIGPEAHWTDYGEPPLMTALVKQPIAFWTDLAFVMSGLAALIVVELQEPGDVYLPMRSATPYSVGLGLIMVWMGPASMLEHGLLLANWGWFDAASIHWFTIFVILYLPGRCIALTIDHRRSRTKKQGYVSAHARRAVEASVFYAIYIAACATTGFLTWDALPRKSVSMVLMAAAGVAYFLALVPTWVRWATTGRVVWHCAPQFEMPSHLVPVTATIVLFGMALAFLFTSNEGGATAPWGHGQGNRI